MNPADGDRPHTTALGWRHRRGFRATAALVAALTAPALVVAACEDRSDHPGEFSVEATPQDVYAAVGEEFEVTMTLSDGPSQTIEVALTSIGATGFAMEIFRMDDTTIYRDLAPGETKKATLLGTCMTKGSQPALVIAIATITPKSGSSYEQREVTSVNVNCTMDEEGTGSGDSGTDTSGPDDGDPTGTDSGSSDGGPSACMGGDTCVEDAQGDCTGGTQVWGTVPGCEGGEHLDITQVDVYCPDPTMRLVFTVAADIPSPPTQYDEFDIALVGPGTAWTNLAARVDGDVWRYTLNSMPLGPDDSVTVEGNQVTFELSEATLAEIGTILSFQFSSYSWSPESGQGPSDEVEPIDNEC